MNASTGLRSIVWSPREGFGDFGVSLPCGQCRYCRLEYSRQWAIRAVHEASMFSRNCFLTLTYSDSFVPAGGSLDYSAPVDFMSRLRERFGSGIRSFGCGEYGEEFSRPHYHLCLFNFDFSDKKFWKNSSEYGGSKNPLYRSSDLEELWPFGFSSVGDLTFESAAYVARYVTKKISAPSAHKADAQDPETKAKFLAARKRMEDHYHGRLPERALCVSRMPGLGYNWLQENGVQTYSRGYVVIRGRKMAPPKYYDRVFSVEHPEEFARFKSLRKDSAKELSDELLRESAWCVQDDRLRMPRHRLSVMEDVKELSFQLLKRGFEDG